MRWCVNRESSWPKLPRVGRATVRQPQVLGACVARTRIDEHRHKERDGSALTLARAQIHAISGFRVGCVRRIQMGQLLFINGTPLALRVITFRSAIPRLRWRTAGVPAAASTSLAGFGSAALPRAVGAAARRWHLCSAGNLRVVRARQALIDPRSGDLYWRLG